MLTKETSFPIKGWNSLSVNGYILHYHPDLTVTVKKEGEKELYLIGYLFGHENPAQGNQEIIEKIFSSAHSISKVIEESDAYTGQFVIIYKKHDQLYISTMHVHNGRFTTQEIVILSVPRSL